MTLITGTGSVIPIEGLSADAPTNVSVTTSSTQILLGDKSNIFVILSNTGTKDAFLAFANTAELDKGVPLLKGTSIAFPVEGGIDETINAIVAAGTTNITIQVWT